MSGFLCLIGTWQTISRRRYAAADDACIARDRLSIAADHRQPFRVVHGTAAQQHRPRASCILDTVRMRKKLSISLAELSRLLKLIALSKITEINILARLDKGSNSRGPRRKVKAKIRIDISERVTHDARGRTIAGHQPESVYGRYNVPLSLVAEMFT